MENRGKHARIENLPVIEAPAPSFAGQDEGDCERSFLEEPLTDSVAMPKKQPAYIRFIVAAVCALAVVGGGAAFAAVMWDSEPAQPEVVEPETIQATVKVDGVMIPGPVLQRGDELKNIVPADELTGAYAGQYYRAEFGGQVIYVPKVWVRKADESAPEQWTGFAAQDAIIFSKPDFSGDDILTLTRNEEIQVLDAFNGLVYVKNADGAEGYMPADKVLREKAPEPVASSSKSTSSSKGSSSSGSSSSKKPSSNNSGDSSPSGTTTPAPQPESTPDVDGDTVGLPALPTQASFSGRGLFGVEVAYADEPKSDVAAASESGSGLSGVVLAADTVTYMGMLNRGDSVTVKVDEKLGNGDALAEDVVAALSPEEKDLLGSVEDVCTVVINEQEFELAEKFLRFETDTPYEVWDGFAVKDAIAYADYLLTVNPLTLEQNAPVHVVDYIGDALIVEINGAVYFMATPMVSKEETEVVEEEPASTPRASSSNSSSSKKPSSSSGSSSSSSSSSSNSGSSNSSSGNSSSGASGSGGSSQPNPTPPADTSGESEWSPSVM